MEKSVKLNNEQMVLLSNVFHEYKDYNRGVACLIKPVMELEAKLVNETDGMYEPDPTYDIVEQDGGCEKELWIHVGFYNDKADIDYLAHKTAEEIVGYFCLGYGAFHKDDDQPEPQEMPEAKKKGNVTKDGYLVVTELSNNDYDSFIDIYRKVRN